TSCPNRRGAIAHFAQQPSSHCPRRKGRGRAGVEITTAMAAGPKVKTCSWSDENAPAQGNTRLRGTGSVCLFRVGKALESAWIGFDSGGEHKLTNVGGNC